MSSLPPYVTDTNRIVLFDNVCRLCSGSVRFILKHDAKELFKFASVQSTEGRAILQCYSMPTDTFETMLYIENGQLFTKSTAFLKIVGHLPFPWFLLSFLIAVPRPARDWWYDRIALNRYKLFGKLDYCYLPDAKILKR
jgi:predicted DCC family thiol-disulfide oxidoreductase YuxK